MIAFELPREPWGTKCGSMAPQAVGGGNDSL